MQKVSILKNTNPPQKVSFCCALSLNVQCSTFLASTCIFIIITKWSAENFDILWLEDTTKTHFCTFAIAEATFSTHHGHCYVFGSVSSQPKASKFSKKCQVCSTFLASLPQWVGHFQRFRVWASAPTQREKGHLFKSNSIKPKRDTRKRIGWCLQG